MFAVELDTWLYILGNLLLTGCGMLQLTHSSMQSIDNANSLVFLHCTFLLISNEFQDADTRPHQVHLKVLSLKTKASKTRVVFKITDVLRQVVYRNLSSGPAASQVS